MRQAFESDESMANSTLMHRNRLTSLGMTARTKRLLLFDIDGTLIHSGGAGVQALKLAFKERFGIDDDLHDIEIAGMTDSGIVLSILKKHKIPVTHENVSAFLDSYVHFLSLELPRRKGNLLDRKSTRLNSSHEWISYAVFCLKKKKKKKKQKT